MRRASILLLVFLITCLPAQGVTCFVYGTVLNGSAQPVAGATFTFQSSNVTRIMTSAADGTFCFSQQFITDPVYTLTPVLANYTFSPPSANLYVTSTPSLQNFTATAGSITTSPLDTAEYFVRQQYVDLLKREPDESGLNFWASNLKACTTQSCRNTERRNIMCAFIASGDYQARFYGSSVTVCQ